MGSTDATIDLDHATSRGHRTAVLALVITLVVGGLPAGAWTAGPTDEPTEPEADLQPFCRTSDPVEGALAHAEDPRLEVTRGCTLWRETNVTAHGEPVVAPIPGGSGVLVAHPGDPGTVTRRENRTGEVLWRSQVPLDGSIGLAVSAESGLAIVGWTGGVAALSLTDGALAWTSKETGATGGSGLGVSPNGTTLYTAHTTSGSRTRDAPGLDDDPAKLVVTAIDVANGRQLWTNSTDLWWHVQAPLVWDHGHPGCQAGPADVVVAPDGTVFAAREQTCRYLGLAVAGFSPGGELAFTGTHPATGEDTRWELGSHRVEGTGLALHPNGRILYAAGAIEPTGQGAEIHPGGLVAFDLATGETLWSRSGLSAESFGRWDEDPGLYCLDPYGSCRIDGGFYDLAVTRRGEVLVAGVQAEDPSAGGPYRLRLVTLDGTTGEPTQRSNLADEALGAPGGQAASPLLDGLYPDVELAVGPQHLTVYAAFRTDEGNRLLGQPLLGNAGAERWHTPPPDRAGTRWALDLEAGDGALVVAGLVPEPSSGDRWPDLALITQGISRGIAHRLLASVQAQALAPDPPSDGTREPSSALTGLAHGERMTRGTPMVEVNATDRVDVEVTIERPGTYYLLVRGVEAFTNYTVQGLPLAGEGPNPLTPSWCGFEGIRPCIGWTDECADLIPGLSGGGDCRPDWIPDPRVWCGAGPGVFDPDPTRRLPLCQQEGEGVCTSALTVVRRHHNWGDKCWGTSRDDPVTFARADVPTGEEDRADAGSVLFGPVPLTEGRYAVLHPHNVTSDAASVTRRCAASAAAPDAGLGDRLAACISVHVEPDAELDDLPDRGSPIDLSAGPTPVPQPRDGLPTAISSPDGDGSGSSSSEDERSCDRDWYADVATVLHERGADEPSLDDHAVMYSKLTGFHVLAWRYGWYDGTCIPWDFRFDEAFAEFDIVGATDVRGTREWISRIGVRGSCDLDSIRACLEGHADAALLPHKPGVYIPDKIQGRGKLYAEHELQAGHTDVDEEVSDVISSILETVADALLPGSGTLVDLVVQGVQALEALNPVQGAPFAGSNFTGYECGLGCEEWSVYAGGYDVNYVHRTAHRPYGCEGWDDPVQLPVKTGIEHLVYRRWLPDEEGDRRLESWVFPTGTTLTAVPVRIAKRGC